MSSDQLATYTTSFNHRVNSGYNFILVPKTEEDFDILIDKLANDPTFSSIAIFYYKDGDEAKTTLEVAAHTINSIHVGPYAHLSHYHNNYNNLGPDNVEDYVKSIKPSFTSEQHVIYVYIN